MKNIEKKVPFVIKEKGTLDLCKKIKIHNNRVYKLEELLVIAAPHCQLDWAWTHLGPRPI